MSRIFKSVLLRETPLVLVQTPPRIPDPEPEEEEVAVQLELVEPAPDPGAELLEAARAQADEIVAAARERADALAAAAENELEELRRKAYDEGYRQGFAEGQASGEAAGHEEARGTIDEAASRAERTLGLAQLQADAALAAAEEQVVELALAVAGKILARQVEENPMVIFPIVKAALAKVQDQEQICLRVNPENFELVLAARPELQACLAGANALAVEADSTLKAGDCIVETPYGTVDARLDTQLDVVKAALRDLLP